HRRPGSRLSDVGPADGGGAARARAPGARRAHRRDARLRPAARVRFLAHAARRQALDRRGGRQGLAGAGAARRRLTRRRADDVRPSPGQRLARARTLTTRGEDRGCPTVALLSASDRPVGRACGNALETEEAILTMHGEGPADLLEVTYALGSEMLLAAGVEKTSKKARQRLANALASGLAAEKFEQLI